MFIQLSDLEVSSFRKHGFMCIIPDGTSLQRFVEFVLENGIISGHIFLSFNDDDFRQMNKTAAEILASTKIFNKKLVELLYVYGDCIIKKATVWTDCHNSDFVLLLERDLKCKNA